MLKINFSQINFFESPNYNNEINFSILLRGK